MRNKRVTTGIATVLTCLAVFAAADAVAAPALRFADVLTDNMVLQRDREIVCWGWAPPGLISLD